MNNNGVNETNNQTIPGVKVAMPDAKPVDASTADAGAALSNAVRINEQPVATAAVQPVLQIAAPSVASVSEPVLQPIASPTATVVVSSVPVASVQPVVTATPAVVVAPTEVSAPVSEAVASGGEVGNKKKEKKPKNKLAGLLFLIIILLIGACAGLWFFHQQQMNIMRAKCTPVSTSGETKELDLDSTIVKDLYGKISTTIREDVG